MLQKQPTDSLKHPSSAYNQTSRCNHLSPASQACLFSTGEERKKSEPEVATSAKSVRGYFLRSTAAEDSALRPTDGGKKIVLHPRCSWWNTGIQRHVYRCTKDAEIHKDSRVDGNWEQTALGALICDYRGVMRWFTLFTFKHSSLSFPALNRSFSFLLFHQFYDTICLEKIV